MNPAIQFTIEISDNNLTFLDILTSKQDNKIWMNFYSKPAYSKGYVPFSSSHPKPCLKNILLFGSTNMYNCQKCYIRTAKLSELKQPWEAKSAQAKLLMLLLKKPAESQTQFCTVKETYQKPILAIHFYI